MSEQARWQFWVDRGGTFTDLVARRPDGQLVVGKELSQTTTGDEDAVIRGIRRLLGVAPGEPLPTASIGEVKLGTTVATNALLERRGEPTLLITNRGLEDVLAIGYQNRPRLFELCIPARPVLHGEVLGIAGRAEADGTIHEPLDEPTLREALAHARERGLTAAAIVLIHAHQAPALERRVAEIARAVGFSEVVCSHHASPALRLVSRGDTSVVDAYLSPVLQRYLDTLEAALAPARLRFMQSHGGLTDRAGFRGKAAVLSGPAGGVVAAAAVAERSGFDAVVSFDMGGTSTDVARYGGELERTAETVIAGLTLREPMLDIHTVAAGGGSVCHIDRGALHVGPASAGAVPGPACYGLGGPLTVTDCNLLLGRVQSIFFPRIFGPDGEAGLDATAARARLLEARDALGDDAPDPETLAEGFIHLAVDNMARAIRRISTERGHDLAQHALCAFGGAGGQLACRLAESLGIRHIVSHPLAGVLSAFGMGVAAQRQLREQPMEQALAEVPAETLEARFTALEEAVEAALAGWVDAASPIRHTRRARLRYAGSDTALELPVDGDADWRAAFTAAHQRQFGFAFAERPLWLESLAVEGIAAEPAPPAGPLPTADDGGLAAAVPLFVAGAWRQVPVYRRSELLDGTPRAGPLFIAETGATTVVDPGWSVRGAPDGLLILTHEANAAPPSTEDGDGDEADPVTRALFANRFAAIAEQMGVTLAQTAQSVNIKERLDFSCAVFDAQGRLIANAPHVPVHLGSMGASVRALIHRPAGPGQAGDAFLTNAPEAGGTHLPDITVITPVFATGGPVPDFFIASRGHHADIGGIEPGSMPAQSTTLEAEGIRFANQPLVREGEWQETALRATLTRAPYPARNPEQNLADLKAQIAANRTGEQALLALVASQGLERVHRAMAALYEQAAEQIRSLIPELSPGRFQQTLETGATLTVTVHPDPANARLILDFTGTSPQGADNFNAPPAVTRACVLYVLRTLIASDIPLNEGCLEPITLRVPAGSLLDPDPEAAVVAGNVETSQTLVDCLYGALGRLAGSQGTMNNIAFGNTAHQYYETLGGGTGAGPNCDGASGVHSHMTNSRLTDPEVLERRHPVQVAVFRYRRGSGGAGAHRGGDGLERELVFRAPMRVSILSSRRQTGPFGLAGGEPGRPGRNAVIRVDGSEDDLPGVAQTELQPGDRLIIETPGGGGYGPPRGARTSRGEPITDP